MSLVTPTILDGSMERAMAQGDVMNTQEILQANATVGSATLTAQQVVASLLNRTGPVGAYNDTTPDANSIIAQLLAQGGYSGSGNTTPQGVNPGTSWRLRHINTVAFIATILAGTGVTLAGVTANAASSWRDYLITVLNGTPQQLFAATTTNVSAVVTGMTAAQTAALSPGMAVSGTGIPGATTILSIQPGVGVTLSANATATGVLVALTFSPRIEWRGIGSGLI